MYVYCKREFDGVGPEYYKLYPNINAYYFLNWRGDWQNGIEKLKEKISNRNYKNPLIIVAEEEVRIEVERLKITTARNLSNMRYMS
jgi:hypothetical protein